METIDLKKVIKFNPDRISREMLSDKPEMRIALMCLKEGQKLEPHKAPLRLMMYCVQEKARSQWRGKDRSRRENGHSLRSVRASRLRSR